MPEISIVVPVYNTEKYIHHCVDSVLKQKYTDFELILVDDGSTDSSAQICDFYENSDHRVKVVHKLNAGVSDARNVGIKVATGRYITFVDADDYIDDTYIECMMQQDGDLICQPGITVDEDGKVMVRYSLKACKYKNLSEKILQELLINGTFNWMACKRFKRAIIENYNIRFNTELSFAEDTLFVMQYAKHCKEIVVQDEANYRYVIYKSRTTLSNELSINKMKELKRANKLIINELSLDKGKKIENLMNRMQGCYSDYLRLNIGGGKTIISEYKRAIALSELMRDKLFVKMLKMRRFDAFPKKIIKAMEKRSWIRIFSACLCYDMGTVIKRLLKAYI